jgi:hypothetical protein
MGSGYFQASLASAGTGSASMHCERNWAYKVLMSVSNKSCNCCILFKVVVALTSREFFCCILFCRRLGTDLFIETPRLDSRSGAKSYLELTRDHYRSIYGSQSDVVTVILESATDPNENLLTPAHLLQVISVVYFLFCRSQ